MNLSDAAVIQVMIPVQDFERAIAFYRDVPGIPLLFTAPLRLAELTDPDGNPLALISDVALAGT